MTPMSSRTRVPMNDPHIFASDSPPVSDGTRELLIGGLSILGVGLVALLLAATVLGGINRDGAHSNSGWFALIVGTMCVPFGLLLSVLGLAKWLRKLRN